MSGRKSGKKKDAMDDPDSISKIQKDIGHWLRRNVPTKKTKFMNSQFVEYFTGSKAVDSLISDSPWSKSKSKEGSEPIFESREFATSYMDELLKHKLFHRAKKIPVQPKKSKVSKEDKNKDSEKEALTTPNPGDAKKKRKIRLDMHLDQIFLDNQDAYVWIYDPIPLHYWAIGSLIVIGLIVVCLFPLWPPIMREGVHYLSLAGAGFLVFILALTVLQYVIFVLLFILSAAKLKFWIFPNLTEDVGFFESFKPMYEYTYTRGSAKAKDSDDEESDDEEEEDNENETEKKETNESDDSKKSSTEKDFEILSHNDSEVDPES